ncbi:MAG: hypothetical protein P1V51_21375 [Deltaproteobacteria bacterium]|nr:hypothetical protein [Deltaproteobacteria bacterium]
MILSRLGDWARAHQLELGLFVACYLVLALFSGPRFFKQSAAPHFIYQGRAWLAGQLHLEVDPPDQEDWARKGDRFYVSFPPFPAVAMLPFVALFGYQFVDTSFTVFFGALNVLLFFLLLERLSRTGDSPRSRRENLIFALLLGFGTVHFYASIRGEVWFTAQTMGVTLCILYLYLAHQARRPFLAGLVLACASLTRTPLAFAFVFFLFELLFPDGRFDRDVLGARLKDTLKRGLLFAAPLVAFAAVMMWMNWVRFESPLEFGHSHLWNNRVNAWVSRYGLFHPHYLQQNLKAAFFALPTFSAKPFNVGFDGHGMSIFLTTPLFLLLLWPRRRARLSKALWASVAVVALPALLYQNDGYFQFGYRFSLDWTPFLFVLLAVGARRMDWPFRIFAAVSLYMGIWGALYFSGGWLS